MSDPKPFVRVVYGSRTESPWIGAAYDTAEEAVRDLGPGEQIYGRCGLHVYPQFENNTPMMAGSDMGRRAHMARLRGELAALEEMEAEDELKQSDDPRQEETE